MLNNHVEWKRLWGKWNELPPPTEKASLHPKVMLCMWWTWKGVLYHELFTVVVQLPSHVWLCDPMDCSMPSFPVPHHLLEFAQVHVHCISDAIQPSHPLSPPSPSVSIFHSNQVFSNESTVLIRWPKYWSSSSSPSNEYSGLISFKIDWFDLIAVQGTHKSLLQHHSLKASMFWHSALFTVQLFQPYMTTGKTIVLLYGPSGKPKD